MYPMNPVSGSQVNGTVGGNPVLAPAPAAAHRLALPHRGTEAELQGAGGEP